MSTKQRTYGLNLSSLDEATYKKVKRQLDRVSMADTEMKNARDLREKNAFLKRELGKEKFLVAELQEMTNESNLLVKLARLLGM